MRYRDTEKKEGLFPVLVSFVFLTCLLWLVYFFSGEPAYAGSVAVLANFKSLTESGSFYSPTEPYPVVLLYYWKKISGLNYLPAFFSMAAFLMSLSVHLSFLLFQKKKWKLNQFLSLYLIVLIPYLYDIPFKLFNELVVFNLFLLLMIFATELSITAIVVFLAAVTIAYFSGLLPFLLFVSFYIVSISLKKSSEMKKRTTVFYKKKNIPFLFLMVYLSFMLLVVLRLGTSNWFSPDGFRFMFTTWFTQIRYFLPLFGLIALVSFLMNEEKELNNSISTGLILVVSFLLIYLNLGRSDFDLAAFQNRKNGIIALQSRGILTNKKVFGDRTFGEYMYFHTGMKLPVSGVPDRKDFILLDGVWAADRTEINQNYKIADYYQYYQIDNRAVIMNRILLEKIIARNLPPATALHLKEKAQFSPETTTGYELFQKNLAGYFLK